MRAKGNSLARINFFQKQVKMEEWKNTMAGKNEDRVLAVIKGLGFVENKDFERQYPIGERFVIDIAFPKEQLAIEVDGLSHKQKAQARKDLKRDSYLRENNWIPLRIKDNEFFGYKGSFYKNLIKELVSERRKQYEVGLLYPVEIPNYIDEDYD